MSGGLVQRLYFRLPGPARSVAATLQGLYLRWWRYGPGSARLAREALEREHWSVAQWDAWRQERLAFVLHRAATRVPYYRRQWEERRRRGDRGHARQGERGGSRRLDPPRPGGRPPARAHSITPHFFPCPRVRQPVPRTPASRPITTSTTLYPACAASAGHSER